MIISYYGFYDRQSSSGAGVHVSQIVTNLVQLGVEVNSWHDLTSCGASLLPRSRIGKLLALRRTDVLYVRLDYGINPGCSLAKMNWRLLLGNKQKHVWELNSLPNSRAAYGASTNQIKRIEDKLIKNASNCDLLICVSNNMAEIAIRRYGFKRVVTIPNASDPSVFSYNSDKWRRLDCLNVAWIGSAIEPWHDLSLIVSAARLCRMQSLPIRFHLAGEGTSYVQQEDNLCIYGKLSYDRLSDWLLDKHVGLICYKKSYALANSPLKMFDYMASGLLILSLPHPQVSQVIGVLQSVNPTFSNCYELVDRLKDILAIDNPGFESQKFRREIELFYNWRKNAESTLQHINDLYD